jgi:hypothetical protein
MALARHQFAQAFAVALGTSAAHETTMVQELNHQNCTTNYLPR